MLPLLTISLSLLQVGGGYVESHWQTGIHEEANLGRSLVFLGDWNGDGIDDYAVGAPGAKDASAFRPGKVFVRSGADHADIHTLVGPNPECSFGYTIHSAGDLDGDGQADLLVGAPFPEPGAPYVSAVYAYSSVTGGLLYTVSDGTGDQYFGVYLDVLGDINQDGTPDFSVSAMGTAGGNGAAHLYSGATGHLIRSHFGTSANSLLGPSYAMGDLNQNGVPDYSVVDPLFHVSGTTSNGQFQVYEGSTGTLLFEMTGADQHQLGSSMKSIGDLDGDGIPEFAALYLEGRSLPDLGDLQWKVFRGSDQQLLYTIEEDQGGFSFSIEVGPDLDGDGLQDLFLGMGGRLNGQGHPAGAVMMASAADGKPLGFLNSHLHRFGASFGSGVSVRADAQPGETAVLVGASSYRVSLWSRPGLGAYRAYTLESFLESSASSVSDAAGGQIQLELNFPQESAGLGYVLLASAAAGPISPGGVLVPLAQDAFLNLSLQAGIPMMTGGVGTLDAQGDATATWAVTSGSLSSQVGLTLHFAAVQLDPLGQPRLSSMAQSITILP